MKQEIKKWFMSKTVWINGLLVLAGIATGLAADLQTGGAITVIGIVNIVLRAISSSKLN